MHIIKNKCSRNSIKILQQLFFWKTIAVGTMCRFTFLTIKRFCVRAVATATTLYWPCLYAGGITVNSWTICWHVADDCCAGFRSCMTLFWYCTSTLIVFLFYHCSSFTNVWLQSLLRILHFSVLHSSHVINCLWQIHATVTGRACQLINRRCSHIQSRPSIGRF